MHGNCLRLAHDPGSGQGDEGRSAGACRAHGGGIAVAARGMGHLRVAGYACTVGQVGVVRKGNIPARPGGIVVSVHASCSGGPGKWVCGAAATARESLAGDASTVADTDGAHGELTPMAPGSGETQSGMGASAGRHRPPPQADGAITGKAAKP